jgi:hypothetical protein
MDKKLIEAYVDDYIDMGSFSKPTEARPYLIDGMMHGYKLACKNEERLTELIKELREVWYNLRSWPHDRIDESKEDVEYRMKNNERLKKKFDEDTDALINGDKRTIDPKCDWDIDRGRKTT